MMQPKATGALFRAAHGRQPGESFQTLPGPTMFVIVLTLILLLCCWWIGDLEFRTKLILTLCYIGSFALAWAKDYSYLFILTQCILAAVLGFVTFGADFLNRRMR
jgi:hypothetical protein